MFFFHKTHDLFTFYLFFLQKQEHTAHIILWYAFIDVISNWFIFSATKSDTVINFFVHNIIMCRCFPFLQDTLLSRHFKGGTLKLSIGIVRLFFQNFVVIHALFCSNSHRLCMGCSFLKIGTLISKL